MNLHWVDWVIVLVLLVLLSLGGYLTRTLVKGVADYLVAGRSVRRYLGLGSDAMQGFGVSTMLAFWQMNYEGGFASQWWYLLTPLAGILIILTGWGVCRLRETRAMTLGQLVEIRYSRRTRIVFGALMYTAGVLNMAIFPALAANFFIYYCGFPREFAFAGLSIPTALPLMVFLVGTSAAVCMVGGQVTLIVTDFIQSVFFNLMLVGIALVVFRTFTWEQAAAAFQAADNAEALLNPFSPKAAGDFNRMFFFMFVAYFMFYSVISWAPNSMLISSSRDAHEARMMRAMLYMRNLAMMGLGLFLLPLAAFVLMHHPDFSNQAAHVRGVLDGIANNEVRSEMVTPLAAIQILPRGMAGAFAGMVIFCFITSFDTYLLAWGGVLIQDVVIPLRGRPLEPRQHIRWIRLSVLAVAVFNIVFSMAFRQVDKIFMWMGISASVYLGAAGVILLGGIYWRRGTTTAAWTAMVVGAALSIGGFFYRICRGEDPNAWDGLEISFGIALTCIVLYGGVSLFQRRRTFDLEAMLHRRPAPDGGLPDEEDLSRSASSGRPPEGWPRRFVLWAPEVPRSDRVLIPIIVAVVGLIFAGIAATWVYNTHWRPITLSGWVWFWERYLYVMFAAGVAFLVWITIGGIRDLRRMFHSLKTEVVDQADDGTVGARRD